MGNKRLYRQRVKHRAQDKLIFTDTIYRC